MKDIIKVNIMIEPFSYFFYRIRKIYCLSDDEPHSFKYGALFAVLIYFIFNAIVILIKNEPTSTERWVLMICSLALYIYFSRIEKRIVDKYDTISTDKHKRIIGNVVFAVEIIATIMSIVVFFMSF